MSLAKQTKIKTDDSIFFTKFAAFIGLEPRRRAIVPLRVIKRSAPQPAECCKYTSRKQQPKQFVNNLSEKYTVKIRQQHKCKKMQKLDHNFHFQSTCKISNKKKRQQILLQIETNRFLSQKKTVICNMNSQPQPRFSRKRKYLGSMLSKPSGRIFSPPTIHFKTPIKGNKSQFI